jgi:hypothetical protein
MQSLNFPNVDMFHHLHTGLVNMDSLQIYFV